MSATNSKPAQVALVQVGQAAPDFTAQDVKEGNKADLKSLVGGEKTVLLFYRGAWCPASRQRLANLSRDYSRFQELNTKVIAVSSEPYEKGKELKTKLNLPFAVLSDPGFEAIDLYGTRTEKDEMKTDQGGGAKGAISQFFICNVKHIDKYASPSLFIIDENGIVRYRFVSKEAEFDYPKDDELLSRINSLR
jgi:peroxiredoxin